MWYNSLSSVEGINQQWVLTMVSRYRMLKGWNVSQKEMLQNWTPRTVTRKTGNHLMTEKRRKMPESAGKRRKTPKICRKTPWRGICSILMLVYMIINHI